jgi:hypothetical protein
MTAIDSVVLGVVSGVITAALLYVVSLLVRYHLLPWYRAVNYRGVDISGGWTAHTIGSDKVKAKFELLLDQQAHELSGSATIIQGFDLEKPSSTVIMDVSGSVWEGFITLNMKSRNRARLSYSTSLFRVLNGGIRLQGIYLFRSIKTDEIQAQELVWERSKNP